MKPLTMLEFVQESNELESIKNYAKFLSQKPEKWMFVPCDDEGNVLEEPLHYTEFTREETQKYQQSLDRVIFEGFTSPHKNWVESEHLYISMTEFKTIEKLISEFPEYLTLKKTIL